MSNPVGRPTKYDPIYCEKILELFKVGASIKEIALELDVNVDTIAEWRKVHPEFSAAVKKGIDFSQGWWEKNGRTNLYDGKFNHVLWMMNMKSRFKEEWRETSDQKHENNYDSIKEDRELAHSCKK